jgi:hypothetical protein
MACTIITHPSSSSDPEFDGLDAPDVAVINLDDAIPTAKDDSDNFDEDTLITLDVLSNDSGLNDTPLTLSIISFPASGSVEVNPDNSITYTPELNFNGDDILSYQVCDVDADCASANVALTVLPINDRPAAVDDLSDTLIDSQVSIDVIDNDTLLLETFDPSSSKGGTIMRLEFDSPEDLSDDQLQYLPPAEFLGTDTFNYTVSDGGLTDLASVTITVHAGDELLAIDDSYILLLAYFPKFASTKLSS